MMGSTSKLVTISTKSIVFLKEPTLRTCDFKHILYEEITKKLQNTSVYFIIIYGNILRILFFRKVWYRNPALLINVPERKGWTRDDFFLAVKNSKGFLIAFSNSLGI